MKLTITIEMDNAAFDPRPGDEAARILHKYASSLRGQSKPHEFEAYLRDENGNTVGSAEVTE